MNVIFKGLIGKFVWIGLVKRLGIFILMIDVIVLFRIFVVIKGGDGKYVLEILES